jgi:hypothetical protein
MWNFLKTHKDSPGVSLEEVERYTRDAKRKLLADRAMKKFKTWTLSVPLAHRGTISANSLSESELIGRDGAP